MLSILAVLLVGPPAAALCIATGLPVLRSLGWVARDLLSMYVCPTPLKSYWLFGAPMAVCVRCWGATIGLWVGYSLAQHAIGAGMQLPRMAWFAQLCSLPVVLRLLLAALPFTCWVAEITFWPSAPYWLLLVNGIQAGIAAGLCMCSIWPGMASKARAMQLADASI